MLLRMATPPENEQQAHRIVRKGECPPLVLPCNPGRVLYFFHDEWRTFSFGRHHPAKPSRVTMAHDLLCGYGIFRAHDRPPASPAAGGAAPAKGRAATPRCVERLVPKLVTRQQLNQFQTNFRRCYLLPI